MGSSNKGKFFDATFNLSKEWIAGISLSLAKSSVTPKITNTKFFSIVLILLYPLKVTRFFLWYLI